LLRRVRLPLLQKKIGNINSILKEPTILRMDEIIGKTPIIQNQEENSSAALGKKLTMTWLPIPNSGRLPREIKTKKSKDIIKRMINTSTSLTERGTVSKSKIYT